MILVDTSVWIDHFHYSEPTLAAALEGGLVLMHPFIVGELACGNLRNREEVLSLLGRLPSAPLATHTETLIFVDRHRLMGRGIGYVDVSLLASVALSGTTRLWTRDRRLKTAAASLDVDFRQQA